ncbi:MAG TPA: response regulator [Kofleriaceae bacterium]|nr:response regulator [Kofleriaceae bacterium]
MTPVVVIVDDDREILQTITRTLRGEPYRLHTFDDPTRVLEFINEHHVDVLVSDIDMPQMSGLELMRRARERAPDAARIIVSGVTSMDAAIKAINDGAVHRFLRKPFDPLELRQAVASAGAESVVMAEASESRRKRDSTGIWRARMERECPGLLQVPRDAEGRYVLDAVAAMAAAPGLGLEHLVRVWTGEP